MTKEELEKFKTKEEFEVFQDVLVIINDSCPCRYGLKEDEMCHKKDEPDCIGCWRYAIESKLKELEESNV